MPTQVSSPLNNESLVTYALLDCTEAGETFFHVRTNVVLPSSYSRNRGDGVSQDKLASSRRRVGIGGVLGLITISIADSLVISAESTLH